MRVMPTAILQGETVHTAHPDEDGETFCGESWDYDSADRIVSMAIDADELVSKISLEEEAEKCQECLENGEDWATPEDIN